MKRGFIYRWTNNINGKMYIGSHMGPDITKYIGSGVYFKNAVSHYGLENFSREILEEVIVSNHKELLLIEQQWIDRFDAANSEMYYNIAAKTDGGNTRVGWTAERKEQFRTRMKEIWSSRSEEEKASILAHAHQKAKTANRKPLTEKQREDLSVKIRLAKSKESFEVRSARAKKATDKMGTARLKEIAKRNAENRTKESIKEAQQKRKETLANRTEEERLQAFQNMSASKKGVMVGSKNGRARKISIDDTIFDTFNDAKNFLNICEVTLRKRLKSDDYPTWFYKE